jgi:hypothetical protein
VNKLRFSWAALSLLAPILIFAALFLGPAGCGGGGSSSGSSTPTASGTAASVQVAFITNFAAASSGFQNFFLNVAGVRMNPRPNSSNTATPLETNGKWVVIGPPTATSTASGSGDVPIDVLGGLSQLQVFNTFGVRSGKFTTIEVVLDTTTPGFIVPQCAGGNLEGCARFPVQLENPGIPLKFLFPIDQQFQTVQHETKQLPILLSASVVSTPSGPGQPYLVNLGASNANNIVAYIGTITGTVTGAKGASSKAGEHLRVTAELAGTNTIVATSDILNGVYTLFLPAAAGIGTLYDLYVSGGSTTIVAQRGLSTSTTAPLFPSPSATATVNFTVAGAQTLGGFSGVVTDACTTLPIAGATVQILKPSGSSSVDCALSPEQCISVATANTGAQGVYPLPATNPLAPSGFQQVPIGSPTATYVLEISAPGYDTLFMKGTAAIGGVTSGVAAGHCFTPTSSPTGTATPANATCSFPLTTAYLQGTLNLTAAQPPGTATTVQVVAENTGTNDLVSALTTPLTIPGGSTSLGFTLNVPTHAFNSSSAQNFDVFAEAQDLYLGGSDPFPGHTILVQQNVGGPPTACATVSAATSGLFGETMDCVGHGSIAGTAANNPDSGTTIELSKGGVAITDAAVALLAPTATASAGYSFCIPPDSYSLQRFEQGAPAGATVAVGPMATPMATDSPCPSTCFNGSGTCPGICSTTAGPTM